MGLKFLMNMTDGKMTFSEQWKRSPTWLNVIGILFIVCPLIWFVYFIIDGNRDNKEFYEKEFSTKVVSSDSYFGRSEEYHLENGLDVYLLLSVKDKIKIGDSLRKDSNTFNYTIYRKDADSVYQFIGIFDAEDVSASRIKYSTK